MMRRIDTRVYVIAVLVVCVAVLQWYRISNPMVEQSVQTQTLLSQSDGMSPARIRTIVDTTAQMLGAQKKSIRRRNSNDSGSVVPGSSIDVFAVFDGLHFITALTDSVRPSGLTVSAVKKLREKTTIIRFVNRDNACVYRCILIQKGDTLSARKKKLR